MIRRWLRQLSKDLSARTVIIYPCAKDMHVNRTCVRGWLAVQGLSVAITGRKHVFQIFATRPVPCRFSGTNSTGESPSRGGAHCLGGAAATSAMRLLTAAACDASSSCSM